MPSDLVVVAADRVRPDQMRSSLKKSGATDQGPAGDQVGAKAVRWLN